MLPCSDFRRISSANFFWSSNCFSNSLTRSLCSSSLRLIFSCSSFCNCSFSFSLSCNSCLWICRSSSASLMLSCCSFCRKAISFWRASFNFSSFSASDSCNNLILFSKSELMVLVIDACRSFWSRCFSSSSLCLISSSFCWICCCNWVSRNLNSSSFRFCHSTTLERSSFSTSSRMASLGSNSCPQLGHFISDAICNFCTR